MADESPQLQTSTSNVQPAAADTGVPSSSESSASTSYADNQQRQASLLSGMQADLADTPDVSVTPGADPNQAAAPQDSPQDAATQAEWRGIRELLPEMGLSPDGYEDDQAALQGLAAQALQAQQAQAQLQQLYQQNQYYQRLLREQQAPQQQAVQPQQPSQQFGLGAQQQGQQAATHPVQPFLPKLPEFDERSIEFLTRDEAGNVVAKPGADPRLVQQYHEWNRAREQAVNKLIGDPQGYADWVYQSQQDRIQKEIESKIESRLQAYHTENDARQYIASNAQRIFQMGPNGQPLLDPASGQPAFTPYGNAFYSGLQQSAQLGLNSYRDRVAYAEQLAGTVSLQQQVATLQQQLAALQAGQPGLVGQATPSVQAAQNQQAAQAQQAAAQNQQRKQEFVQKNRGQVRKANRTATLAAAKYEGVPQNGQYRLHEMLTQGFRDEGLLDSN